MSKIVKVYCEGKQGSWDFFVLQKINEVLGNRLMIRPIGGKRGAKSIIQYQEQNDVTRSDFFLFFRDRDFDIPVQDKASLTQNKYVCFSHRTTIENYLITPSAIKEYCNQINEKHQTTINGEQLLMAAANQIREYQAVRHALGKLRNPDATFQTTWTEKSGKLPESLELEACKTEASKLLSCATNATEHWNQNDLDIAIQCFLNKFDENFMQNHEYLVWFQGKDLLASLSLVSPEFHIREYLKFASDLFHFADFPDLVDLHGILSANLNKITNI
jgi:hypothetical protein